ncbi:MAG: MFS transporter [Desulfurococcaceae archaeon]
MDGCTTKYYKVWLLYSAFYSFSTTMSTVFYQSYAIRVLNFEVEDLGNVTSLNIAMIALGNFNGLYLLHKFRDKRLMLWRISIGLNAVLWSLIGFTDLIKGGHYLFYACVALAQFSGAMGGLASSDTIADMIPKDLSVKVFSKLNTYVTAASFMSLSTAVAVFNFMGISVYSYRVCYGLSMISAITSAGLLSLIKDLNVRKSTAVNFKVFVNGFKEIFDDTDLRNYASLMAMFMFAANLPAALWNYYLITVFRGDEVWISVNNILNVFALTLGSYVLSKRSHKLNPRKTLVYSITPISFVPVVFLISPTMASQALMNFYSGLSWSGFNLMTSIYNLYLPRESNRLYFLSTIGIVNNSSAALASRLGAYVASVSLTAMQLVFIASCIGRLLSLIYAKRKLPNI